MDLFHEREVSAGPSRPMLYRAALPTARHIRPNDCPSVPELNVDGRDALAEEAVQESDKSV